MSDSSTASAPVVSPPVKRRHPIERALVWSLIASLLTLAFVETWSRYSYQRAYDFLGNRLEFGDEHGADALDAGEVKEFLRGRQPARTEDFILAGKLMANGATHLEVYSWYTLNPVHRREMFVYYDSRGPARKVEPQVLSIQATEDEFIPMLVGIEQHPANRRANDGPGGNANTLPRMPGRRGMGRRGGRNGRPRDSNQAVDQPADEARQVNQPATDTTEI